jgi:hypothetical protein
MSIKHNYNQALIHVEITTFRLTNSPPDETPTRSSSYAKVLLLESLVCPDRLLF